MNFAGKVRECIVPKCTIGEKQASGLFIGVKTVVNEDRELADLGKHLR